MSRSSYRLPNSVVQFLGILLFSCISYTSGAIHELAVSIADLSQNAPEPMKLLSTTIPYMRHSVNRLNNSVDTSSNDFTQLIDLYDFNFLKQVPKCDDTVQALIAIHSAAMNQYKRTFIRQTWGNMSLINNPPFRIIFLIGAVENVTTQNILDNEQSLYGDIVQGSFVDVYRNLTYKHIMGLKWFQYYCSGAQLYIKLDDDRLLNTPLLAKYLYETNKQTELNQLERSSYDAALFNNEKSYKFNASKYLFQRPKNLIFCEKRVGHPVLRMRGTKWTVTETEYVGEIYPPHCPGFANIYSADVVRRLYAAAQNTPYFWIDDVHVSGTVRAQTGVDIMDYGSYAVGSVAKVYAASAAEPNKVQDFLFSSLDLSPTDKFVMWQLFKATVFELPSSFKLHERESMTTK